MPLLGAVLSITGVDTQQSTALTPATTVTLIVTQGPLFTETAAQNQTINCSGTQVAGQVITLHILNDGTSPRTITFGGGFLSSGTVVGTINKTASITFRSNGTNFLEMCRTLSL